MCEDFQDCNDRGLCIDESCNCDVGWFGDTCDESLRNGYENSLDSYIVIFMISYIILFLYVFGNLVKKLKKERAYSPVGSCSFVFHAIRSPYNLSFVCILILALTRIVWLAADPFLYDDGMNRSLERVLSEIAYSLLFIIYANVFWVWYSIYKEIKTKKEEVRGGKKRCRCSCIKPQILFFNCFVFLG